MSDKSTKISEAEWIVLEALWEAGQATARELADNLAEHRGWARTTVKTMLDRMAAKGVVVRRSVGNNIEYRPALDAAEARRSAWRRFVDSTFGGSLAPALAFIASDAELTPKQRRTLRKLLEDGANE